MSKYLIDDHVPRSGYYWVVKEESKGKELKEREWYTYVVNVGTFLGVCGYIWWKWGMLAAIIYLVYPLNVGGWAWCTGNYYMSTVLMLLSGSIVGESLVKLGQAYSASWVVVVGKVWEVMMYWVGVESTVTAVGWVMYGAISNAWIMIPLVIFLNGRRFGTAIRKREEAVRGDNIQTKIRWRSWMVTLPYYVYKTLVPYRLGFFHEVGSNEEWWTRERLISGVMLLLSFVIMLAVVDWRMMVMWVGSVLIFSQVLSFGQFWSERYTHVGNVVWAVVASKLLGGNEVVASVYCTVMFCISWNYYGAWKDNGSLFSQGVKSFPKQASNYINLGAWYLLNRKWSEAIKPLVCAIHLTKGSKGGIYTNLANAYGNEGEYETALGYTKMALGEGVSKESEGKLIKQMNELNNKIIDEKKGRKHR